MKALYYINGEEAGEVIFSFPSNVLSVSGKIKSIYTLPEIESHLYHLIGDYGLQVSFTCMQGEYVTIIIRTTKADMLLMAIHELTEDMDLTYHLSNQLTEDHELMFHEKITLNKLHGNYIRARLAERVSIQSKATTTNQN